MMVLPQTELSGAYALAERIRDAFENASTSIGNETFVSTTASFGVASVPACHPYPPTTPEALIGAADEQLYAVKRGGRNGVRGTIVTSTPELLRSGT
ncbi:MAG: hypothetical protein V7631_4611 [Massilia sp.]|jgi:diguanylate cyclase (GGDEF)-like protein